MVFRRAAIRGASVHQAFESLGRLVVRHPVAVIAAWLALAAVLFLSLLRLFPEPRAVYGPEGARLARTVEVPVPPITGPGASAAAPALATEGS